MNSTATNPPRPNVLLVNADRAAADSLEERMPGCEWIEAPSAWPHDANTAAPGGDLDAVLVSVGGDSDEESVVETCKRIRERCGPQTVPVLVELTMYQMHIANRVRKEPQTDFLLKPIEEESLLERIESMQLAIERRRET